MDQPEATVYSALIAALGGIVVALIKLTIEIVKSKKRGGRKMKTNYQKIPKSILIAFIASIPLFFVTYYVFAQTGKPDKPTNDYIVYQDKAIAQGDILVWSGADWQLEAPRLLNGAFVVTDAPEGTKCYAAIGGSGDNNYVGWGVFLGTFDQNHKIVQAHTADLSQYSLLIFYAKTGTDLKVEIQQDDANGKKSIPLFISKYGWDSNLVNQFVRISIPINNFSGIDLRKVYCPFMITGTGNTATFYVDDVRWARQR